MVCSKPGKPPNPELNFSHSTIRAKSLWLFMYKYRRLLKYAHRRRGFFAFILLLTLASSALAALQPWPMKLLVDHVLGYNPVSPLLKSIFNLFGLRPTATVFLLVGTIGGLALFVLNSVLEVGLV